MNAFRVTLDDMSACPTILQVLPALGTGGIERGTIEIARGIMRAGGRAIVASAPGKLLPALNATGALHIPLDLSGKSPTAIWRNRRKLSQIMRQHGVDLIHARSRAPAWAAIGAAHRCHVPLVTTWHGVHHAGWWGKKRYNAVLARGDRVIAISGYIAERLGRDYRVPAERLRLIHRGVDLTSFDPARVPGPRIQALADAWAIPHDTAVVMLPGRLTSWKGQLHLLEALAGLDRSAPDIRWVCVFVGPGEQRDRYVGTLSARVAALGLAGRVRFSGHCGDMPAAFALADVVVVPSQRPEPFGRVVAEAQAMGRPVIVADHGAAAEIVQPGETGLLVPPHDRDALTQAIADVLGAPRDALDLLAQNARAHVSAHFSVETMQRATLSVYDELLGTQLAPTFQQADIPDTADIFRHFARSA